MQDPQRKECPCCRVSSSVAVFYEHRELPIHSCLLVSTREEALRFPTGDLCLGFCQHCGFIWNIEFQPGRMRYSASYEETQVYSPRFQEFQSELVERWITRYQLRESHILEVGCGKGDFLLEMCERGANTGVGIDPSYRSDRHGQRAIGRAEFIRELYSESHTSQSFDFICCRHTLEHIHHPRLFMELIGRQATSSPQAVVAFELPDIGRVLAEHAFWDIYYEHCSYFSLGSLGRLFRSMGLEIIDLFKDYDGQYLIVEARRSSVVASNPHAAEEPTEDLKALVAEFQQKISDRFDYWRRYVRGRQALEKRLAIWGAGSKAVAFLSRLKLDREVSAVVDINPHKHGKFLAGTGHEIVPPSYLQTNTPDTVLVMNPIYIEEISQELDSMNVNAEVVSL